MAGRARATLTITYPLGSPESYEGEESVQGQLALEQSYLAGEDGQGDYLHAVLGMRETEVDVVKVEEV